MRQRGITIDGLTSKERHKKVAERSQGLCENCYSPKMVQHHHIIKGRGKRKQCETVYSIIALCYDCHYGTWGVHGREGRELDIKLKADLQNKYFDMGYTEEEVRKLMGGKLY